MKFEKDPEKSYDIYGEVHTLRLPTVKESKDYSKKTEGLSQEDSLEGLLDFLEVLGLPKAVSESMQEKHLVMLVEDLLGVKKK